MLTIQIIRVKDIRWVIQIRATTLFPLMTTVILKESIKNNITQHIILANIGPWQQPRRWSPNLSTALPQEQQTESVEEKIGIPSQYQREHKLLLDTDMVSPKETEGMALSHALAQECEEMA